MKKLNEKEGKILINSLIEDRPFSEIRKKLKLSNRYNLKLLCEYNGLKFSKAYEIHKNNLVKNCNTKSITKIGDEVLTKEDFKNGLEMMYSLVQNKPNENKQLKNNNDEITEIVLDVPEVLPDRLQGKNYKAVSMSARVVENVAIDFKEFTKNNKTHNAIKLHSLALLEFMNKYNGR